MLVNRKSNPLLLKAELENVRNTTFYTHARVSTHGKRKTIITVGTTHGEPCIEEVGKMLDKVGDETYAILLEKPSIQDVGLHFYTDPLINKSGLDATQNNVALRHAQTLRSREVDIVGVDGRKIFAGVDNKYRNIGLTQKQIDKDYILNQESIHEAASSGGLLNLAINIIDCCLGINRSGFDNSIVETWDGLIKYKDGTEADVILLSLFNRVNTLSAQLVDEDKIFIRNHLLDDIQRNIDNMLGSLCSDFQVETEEYKVYLKARQEKMMTTISTFNQTSDPDKSMEELLDEEGFDENDFMLMYSTIDIMLADHHSQLAAKAYANLLDSVIIRACCDLRLYTELLCHPKDNIVIVFGKNHTDLLDDFIVRSQARFKAAAKNDPDSMPIYTVGSITLFTPCNDEEASTNIMPPLPPVLMNNGGQ